MHNLSTQCPARVHSNVQPYVEIAVTDYNDNAPLFVPNSKKVCRQGVVFWRGNPAGEFPPLVTGICLSTRLVEISLFR